MIYDHIPHRYGRDAGQPRHRGPPRRGGRARRPPRGSERADDADEKSEGEAALSHFEEEFDGEDVSVTSHQFYRDRSPAEEIVHHATEVNADEIVTGLRRHSRTERIIFGSVSQRLLQQVTRPIKLVPLPEYQAPA